MFPSQLVVTTCLTALTFLFASQLLGFDAAQLVEVMVGVFTSGLTQQYIIGGSGARQLATLKRYLKQNNVSKGTTKLGESIVRATKFS